jgi:hypothetical protein
MDNNNFVVPIVRNPTNAFQEKYTLQRILEGCRAHNDFYETHERGEGLGHHGDDWIDPVGEPVSGFWTGKIPWTKIPQKLGWDELKNAGEKHLEVLVFSNVIGRRSTIRYFWLIVGVSLYSYEVVENKILKRSCSHCGAKEANDIEHKLYQKYVEGL